MDSRVGLIALVLVGVLAFGMATCAGVRAQSAREYPPLDPRFEREPSIERNLKEGLIGLADRWPRDDTRPLRCSIRRTVEADFLPEDQHRRISAPDLEIPEPVAPLREYEFGFERTSDPATPERIEAYMRFRFERLSDGKPLHVARPKIDFDGGWGVMSEWPETPIDPEGFSGARIDTDDLDEAELQRFFRTITAGSRFAVTLPELGQDRVYWFAFDAPTIKRIESSLIVTKTLADCVCAFGNDEISHSLRRYCKRN